LDCKKISTSLMLLFIVSSFSANSAELSAQASAGKSLFPACFVCHNPEMDPPLGPPMWSIQRLYKRNSIDAADFIQSMVSFVKAPSLEMAIHKEGVKRLGLMPALPLPDEMLSNIAAYIHEEQFEPPCAHWGIAVKRASESGDTEHASKDQRMLDKYCQ